ncbi:putative acetyltransferase [Labilithrix luteola]|uniref:Putative acetyltransferase n=1 Tax=Labilithrix luteola TaxID=1391654 RepID=A0A0K1Q6U8_9BACT|nr:GNAT family N-acetyltransferase [Labilithrix luteola]AKV01377.1 putative acetyltransferase [Labilithrix luteola]
MNVVVRPALLSEVADVQRIGVEADERFVEVGHPELADGSTMPTEAAEKAIASGRLLVAETVEGRVVGWSYVGRIGGELCLGQISVALAYGRCGVGTALLRAIIEGAKAAGEPSIVLNTQADVPWNLPWYERHGFRVIEREAWTPELERIAVEQSASGLDWANRVHMRLALR